ncbi:formyltransferase family protein [Streptomyces sp. NPDC048717]|uniref:formyl transferase n=1 Tax=Streptomyces sp. NPDC048717 TaxID=3154928 RepID=UPI00341C691D
MTSTNERPGAAPRFDPDRTPGGAPGRTPEFDPDRTPEFDPDPDREPGPATLEYRRAVPAPGGAGTRLRVVLLCSDDPLHRYLRSLLAARLDLVATLVEPGDAQRRRQLRKRRYRDLAARRYQEWRSRLTGRSSRRARFFDRLAEGLPAVESPSHTVESVNDPEARALVAELAPELTVVCGTMILGRRLLASIPGIIVNLHGGWLPEYRGNHGYYFAYKAGDWERVGATLHIVDPALDTGPVLARVRPETRPGDTDERLSARAGQLAALRLVELALAYEQGTPLTAVPQPDRGTTYRHRDRTPGAELLLWLRRRAGHHRVPVRSAFRDGGGA